MSESLVHALVDLIKLASHLSVLKSCLPWRFFISDETWKSEVRDIYTERLCLFDEELRVILYPEGFFLNSNALKYIADGLKSGCSEDFRMAFERYLFANENVDEQNQYVIAARKA